MIEVFTQLHAAAADSRAEGLGQALRLLFVLAGVLLAFLLVLVAHTVSRRMRRRSESRRDGAKDSSPGPDAWSESARRLDPETQAGDALP